MRRMTFLLGLILILALTGVGQVRAQDAEPVVYAVLFFSPTCPHCHEVMDNVLPPLLDQYGDQFKVVYIDVSIQGGAMLYYAACDVLEFPGGRCGSVPAMIVGETVMLGSGDIPARLPGLIESGLASGGVGLPAIEGLREAYEQATDEATAKRLPWITVSYTETTWQDRFQQDPAGNGLAVGVLGVLAAGLGVQVVSGARGLSGSKRRAPQIIQPGRAVLLALAVVSAGIAGTLALEGSSFALPNVLAALVTLGLIGVIAGIARAPQTPRQAGIAYPAWLLPAIAVLGLIVAGYLAYVEVTADEAVCGAVGDCNAVQQSDYASLFGVLPIGVLGVIGYLCILSAWGFSRSANERTADWGRAALLGFALFGTAFSLYLTFLEPFVIGATCAWCLTSAMLMILVLALHAADGWHAIVRLRDARSGAPRTGKRRTA